jgi:hypothetical protein
MIANPLKDSEGSGRRIDGCLGGLHYEDWTWGEPDEAFGDTAHKEFGRLLPMRPDNEEVDLFVARHCGKHVSGLAPAENRLGATCRRCGRRSLFQQPLGHSELVFMNLLWRVDGHRHRDMDETQFGVKPTSQIYCALPGGVCILGKISANKDSLEHAGSSGAANSRYNCHG